MRTHRTFPDLAQLRTLRGMTALATTALLAAATSTTFAQSRAPALPETYSAADRAFVIFNAARPEFTAFNPDSQRLPKYKVPLDPPQVNIQSREEVLAFYHGAFGMQAKWAPYWSGNVSTCDAGTTKRSYQESMVARTNWWRAMVGRPNTVSFKIDPLQTTYSQAAAMVLSANKAFTHDIPTSFSCYSSGAQWGARTSSLDGEPWTEGGSVDGYIQDAGKGNEIAGHRASLLSVNSRFMGAGTTGNGYDAIGNFVKNSNARSALGTRQPVGVARAEPVIAWPPAGYFFRNHVPGRWSYDNQALRTAKDASVRLQKNGIDVPLTVVYRTGYEEFNDAGLVWDLPKEWWPNAFTQTNAGTTDDVYTVTISNLTGFDGKSITVSYTATAINPYPGYANWNGDQTANAVSEFYWVERDTYFVSLSREDADTVDEVNPALYRTWRGFYAWDSEAKARAADASAVPVCRWFFKAPISSHFYSAKQADCDLLKQAYGSRPDIAVQDTAAAFYVVPPNAAGQCAEKYQPITRLFNNQVDTGKPANHRYTAHPDDIRKMVALGWVSEGVAFCAPRKKEMYPLTDDWQPY